MIALSTGTNDIVTQSDVTPEEASGVTENKLIDDLLIQKKCKLPICFSPVLPESSSGVTENMTT